MKRQKREENAIVIHFVFYFVLTIGLFLYFFSSIYPQISSIEDKKNLTRDLYNTINRIEKNGLTFDEFKNVSSDNNNSIVIKEILKSMTEDFYTENFVNKTYSSYKEFLDNKKEEINSDENKNLVSEKMDLISTILPPYSDTSIDFSDKALTDFKFINYVESIIETFNLSTSNSIGISKVTLLEDYATNNTNSDSLDSNIYYIPLNLILKGTKSGIIDFLYFIENVGNITVENGDININNNYGFLSKNGIKRVLEGDRLKSDYNIFEHQIIDIDRILINDYIDSSYETRGDKEFKDFILDTQGYEDYEVNVNLMFYVKGLPTYKLEEFISNILDKYKETLGLVNKGLSNTKTDEGTLIKLNNYNKDLKQIDKEVIDMRKSLAKKDKLEELYKKVITIDEIIDPIFKSLSK